MQNRRYPESTTLETYRLSEWTYFFKWSGDLPSNSVTMLPDLGENFCDNNGTYTELSSVQFAHLEMLYVHSPEIRSELSRKVFKIDRYTYNDKYGRTVTRTSIDGDSGLSVSSYIYSKSSDRSLVFGRVQFFFQERP